MNVLSNGMPQEPELSRVFHSFWREKLERVTRLHSIHDTPFVLGVASGSPEDFGAFTEAVRQTLMIPRDRVHTIALSEIGSSGYKGGRYSLVLDLCKPLLDAGTEGETHLVTVSGFFEMFPPGTKTFHNLIHHDSQSIQEYILCSSERSKLHAEGKLPRFVVLTHLPSASNNPRINDLILDAHHSRFNQFVIRLDEEIDDADRA